MYSRYIRKIIPTHYLFNQIKGCKLKNTQKIVHQLKLNRHMSNIVSSLDKISLIKSTSSTIHSFFNITDSCAQMLELLVKKKSSLLHLRVSVDSGGCSGFQYTFTIEPHNIINPTDIIQRHHLFVSAIIVTDVQSINFLQGSTIDYVSDIIKSGFMVTENNIAESACGCGSSFAVKNFASNNKY